MSKVLAQMEIPVAQVKVDHENVRKKVGALGDLEDSIEKYGVLEPIIVRKDGKGYQVVAGSLRVAASKSVGLKMIPAIVKEMSDEEAFIESAIENLQRHTLEPDEEAQVFAKAYQIFKTQGAVAKAFSVSERVVSEHLEAAGLIGLIKATKKPGHAPVEIPRDTSKVARISVAAKSIYEDSPKKQVEMFEALKDKPREDVKRAITYLKAQAEMEPEAVARKSVSSVVDEAFKVANVSVKITFDGRVSKGLIKAAKQRDMSWEDIVQTATEKWLKGQGFL